ncbi:hypothetical protein CG747_36665 [Streptomyces sp. CB02959]|uniref:helix-turn-helix domain-containing protein n=1 Tax=Streptomyces sp. CB02959 TaxID=2020330 RepID=UPI000C278738|nr:helix-turn-helix domain-containing protein [Streptomyces sp. CB02959]PJN35860.1 hypothetical protein CG747_36665 [Streptomyces sp. CB02959]
MTDKRPADGRFLTLTELLQQGLLADVTVYGPVDRSVEVRGVRIADRLDVLDGLQPHTAVVLTALAASASWTVEMALRKAWEHAAACVVVAQGTVNPASVAELAERLGVPLLVVAGDAPDAAVRIASAVAQPEAGRTALLAAAARRIAEAGTNAPHIVSALHAVLPSTSVALVIPGGEVIAGRAAALDEHAGSVAVRVEVNDPEGGALAWLVARSRTRAAGWASTVQEILGLAIAPLTAWAARERLRAERTSRYASGLLAELLTRRRCGPSAGPSTLAPDPLLAQALALGWPLQGPFTVNVIRPAEAADAPEPLGGLLCAWWSRGGRGGPLVAYEGCWVAWAHQGEPADISDPLGRAERRLRAVLTEPTAPVPLAGAVAGPVNDLAGLGPALDDAVAAVRAARPLNVVRADRMGPARLLAALPTDALRAPAEALLAPVLRTDRDGSLLRTLAAWLDAGAASAVAARLGVHRNTVTARMERLRALGCDPDDPALRLALHLACRVLLEDPNSPDGPSAT